MILQLDGKYCVYSAEDTFVHSIIAIGILCGLPIVSITNNGPNRNDDWMVFLDSFAKQSRIGVTGNLPTRWLFANSQSVWAKATVRFFSELLHFSVVTEVFFVNLASESYGNAKLIENIDNEIPFSLKSNINCCISRKNVSNEYPHDSKQCAILFETKHEHILRISIWKIFHFIESFAPLACAFLSKRNGYQAHLSMVSIGLYFSKNADCDTSSQMSNICLLLARHSGSH